MANIVKFLALGGLDENGKNLYILDINDDIFVFEAGMKFPVRNNTGVDMIVSDVSYLVKNKARVKAYFISHGHDDIMGGLGYVYKQVPAPIYCSDPTRWMIELTAQRFKIDVKFDFRIVDSGSEEVISGHKVTFFGTTHSARNSLGFAIETGNGLAVYTSDFLFDFEPLLQYRTDVNLLSRIADQKVLMLFTESIAVDKPGHTSPNHKLKPYIEPICSEPGRVFISLYYQNIFGIREAMDAAIKYNKKIYIYGEHMKQMLDSFYDNELKNIIKTHSIRDDEVNRPGNENVLVIIGGQGEEVFTYLSKMSHGEDKMFDIRSTDSVIVANPFVSGLENIGTKVLDELYKTGAKIFNVTKQVCSMHAHEEDIKMMISIFKPKYYIPLKGEYKNLTINANIARNMNCGYSQSNVFIFDNGLIGKFVDGQFAGLEDQLELHDIMIDGLEAGDVESSVLLDRARLGEEGALVIGITVDSLNKTIIAGPDIQMRGLVFVKEADNLVEELAVSMNDMVNEALKNGSVNKEDTKIRINEKLNYLVRKYTGKSPLILPVIVDIQAK